MSDLVIEGPEKGPNTPQLEISDELATATFRDAEGRTQFIGVTGLFVGDGLERWFENGRLHRLDGPALTRADGTRSWYLDGVEYTESQHSACVVFIPKPRPVP